MTTITASSYSPDTTAQPSLTPLTRGQVQLLNQGNAHDISQKVRTVVQRHLGYQGRDVFRTTFTKQEIIFTLRNGPATENRTLKLENGHWMLSQNSAPAAPLNQALENEVNAYVTEILDNIGQASQANAPDPAAPVNGAAAVDAVAVDVPGANAGELVEIRQRLTALEAQLRANPTLERSLEVQQRILEQLAGLRAALERHPQANNAERDALRGQVDQLQRTLVEEGRRNEETLAQQGQEFERAMRVGQARFEQLRAELATAQQELEGQQQSHLAKDQAAAELQLRVAALETEVAQKADEQRHLSGALDASKSEVATVSQQRESLQDQLAAARQDLERQQQSLPAKDQAAAELQERVAALENQLAQKASEQRQLSGALETSKSQGATVSQQRESLQEQLTAAQQDLEREQQALAEKGKTAAALQERVVELEATVSQKDAEQKKALETFETFKAQKESIQKQIQAQCAREVQAADKIATNAEQAAREAAALTNKGIAEFREQKAKFQAEKASLEEQLKAARSRVDSTGATAQQLEELQTAYTALLANNDKREAAFAGLSRRNDELFAELQSLQETAEQVEALGKENSRLMDGIALAQRVFETDTARIKLLSGELETATQTQGALRVQNTDLNSKLQAAETAGKVSTLAVQDLQSSLKEKQQQLERAKKTTGTVQAALEKAKQQTSQALNELQRAKDALLEARLDVEYMEGERSRSAKANAEAQLKLRDLQPVLAEKNAELESLKRELEALKASMMQRKDILTVDMLAAESRAVIAAQDLQSLLSKFH